MQQSAQSIMMVAGEASADTHGARVLRALRQTHPHVRSFGVGGKAMQAEGFATVVEARELALVGLTEVLWALPRIWRRMRCLCALATQHRPRVAVLIDLPDFNLRLAARLKKLGIPVVYFISPQVWAWRPGRVRQIRRLVDRMLVVLPFEEAFYKQHGIAAEFVGHPLVEQLPAHPDRAATRRELALTDEQQPVVALLPGSRRSEVARHLPTMLRAIAQLRRGFPNLATVLPIASTIDRQQIERLVAASGEPVTVIDGQATQAVIASDAAVVCSGTATLQTALLGRPMVVVYRVSWLTYQLLRRLVKVAHIALINLIAGRRLVPELLQHEMTPDALAATLQRLLADTNAQRTLATAFEAIRQQLGRQDTAQRVAQVVSGYLDSELTSAAASSPPAVAPGRPAAATRESLGGTA